MLYKLAQHAVQWERRRVGHGAAVVLKREQSAGYLANHMARLFAIRLTERLLPLGLATAQFAILLALWDKQTATQKQLVEYLDIEQATVGNTLNRMERDGLIVRSPHPEDGRSQVISMTQKARDVEMAATQCAIDVNAEALADLDGDEAEQLLKLMRKVVERLRAHRTALPRT